MDELVRYRVLHILSGMNPGGIETWLMNVLRRIDTTGLQFDFLVESAGSYEREIATLGGRILRAPRFRHRLRFARRLVAVLRHEGPYDVVHVHGLHSMGLPISVAAALGVPIRIGHVHNFVDDHGRDALRRAYKRLMKALLVRNATWVLGCSQLALESMCGAGAMAVHDHLAVLHCGIDVERFTRRASRRALEREFALAPGCQIVGHVGRFVRQKNHAFLVDVLAELVRRDRRWVLLLVGAGPLRADIESRLARRGLSAHVRFAGVRADIPELMSAMDVFAFPSRKEGLGLVLIEAQALGLPCVISRRVPGEAVVDNALVQMLAVDAGAAIWAEAIVRAATTAPRVQAAHALVAASPFTIARSTDTLLNTYYNLSPARQ